MLLAYDKTTGEVLYNSGTNSSDPGSVLFPPEAVAAITGRSDLGILRLNDNTDAALVAKTFTNVVTVSGGKVFVGSPLGEGASPDPTGPVSPATAEQLMAFINKLQEQQDALTAQQVALQQQSDDLMLMMFGGAV